ncbi:RNA-binding domain-containing protein [Microthyrium microscopicum]|uniref:RNA-binding domain-containing protein n=1 Tax=Microthyrium microscopicum TaxID=703497 RepID=A0A6A6UTZ7_9PEZI|nr:RNA-binding domain-containing protein [Microthyrium microscopicum]
MTQWDIKPVGYENVTAEQAKLSGMFPLPGAPRQQVMDPTKLQAFMNQPDQAASAAALKPSNARQSKRLFIYNIPKSATDESLVEFFNLQLNGMNVIQGHDPCLSGMISKDRHYGMVEFRQPEDATVALVFDGTDMEASDESNGAANGSSKGLKIKRPQDYIAPGIDDSEQMEGLISNSVKDSPNKISISHVPVYIDEAQLTDLLTAFGALKGLVLVKDTSTEQSRGIAFCEYADPATTTIAVESLNGMTLGAEKLRVQLASVGVQQVTGVEMSVNAMSLMAGTRSDDLREGRVLQLLNMVTADELMDNDEYLEIMEDVKEECGKFGGVEDVKIPRPTGTRLNPGVGKIFVKFETMEAAGKALTSLAGRKFADRTVVVTYFGEEYFDVNAW